ncbi:MAG: PAS and helix-turn-helix domain-containing protein [Bacteroidales bacterium]|nr:PAS and helix-turn-helix domain-containing protein [Bacteroidales bacterium]
MTGWSDGSLRVFVVLLFVMVVYGSVMFIKQCQLQQENFIFWTRINTLLWGIIMPLSYQTLLSLLHEKSGLSRITLLCLSAVGAAVVFFSIGGLSLYKGYYLVPWGCEGVIDTSSWFFWFFMSFLLFWMCAFIITLESIRHKTGLYRMQKLAHAILLNFLVGGVLMLVPFYILSYFRIPAEVFLNIFGSFALTIIVIAIQKYQPEKVSTSHMLTNITSYVSTDTFIISPEGIILSVNRNKLLLTGFLREEMENQTYDVFFAETSVLEKEMQKISVDMNYFSVFEADCQTRSRQNVRLKVSMSGLRNEFNDVFVFLLVFNSININAEILDLLQVTYRLSVREKEVASLVLKGYSNNEISDRLYISLNTVKTHTRNIYLKTGTANRSELKKEVEKIGGDLGKR